MNFKDIFLTSMRPHILMITNHGIHQWEIIPGLPDTGGQNIFVNQFSSALALQGFKITIVNRGGYEHPVSGEPRVGFHYKDENRRILYLDDGLHEFVRKEDMNARLPYLNEALQKYSAIEGMKADLIISHYWDGAKLGVLYNLSIPEPIKHIWIPHSLGAVKKRNVNPNLWEELRFDERISIEKKLIKVVDGVTATSAIIRQSLKDDYGYQSPQLFLPPCVDTERYQPRTIKDDHAVWRFLSKHTGITLAEIRESQIITEISRTDTTKRKDILVKAFARVNQQFPKTLLVITIDQINKGLASELLELIRSLKIEKRVAVLGSVWDELPGIYNVTDIYCTPSVMEGFGMTSQEAAASGVPVVASDLVPFASEYLLGEKIDEVQNEDGISKLKVGQGAIIAPADDVGAFSNALKILLSNETLRYQMGKNAYQITIPYFTWESRVAVFLKESGVKIKQEGREK